MNKLYIDPDINNLQEVEIPKETQIFPDRFISDEMEPAIWVEPLIFATQNISVPVTELSVEMKLFAKNFRSFTDWYYDSIIFPQRYDRYSWICSGILLISLGFLFLFSLLNN